MDQDSKILLIDDDHDNLRLLKRVLINEGYDVKTADSGTQGLQELKDFGPDLILLDVNMPELDGLETIQLLKKKDSNVAVIFITGNTGTEDVIRGLEAGALDYIRKPFSTLELLARVRTQLRVKKLQDDLRQANLKLKNLVDTDDLTGLFNMRSVYEKLGNEIDRARRYGHGVGVIMLDMDHFKRVNDDHDHLFGSFVLSEVGKMIRTNIRSVDFAARYGGDEFLICLTHTDIEGARQFAERLRKKIADKLFQQKEDEIQLTASMGVAVIAGGKSSMDGRSLVRHADRALYESKEKGRNCVTVKVIEDKEPPKHKFMRAQ